MFIFQADGMIDLCSSNNA